MGGEVEVTMDSEGRSSSRSYETMKERNQSVLMFKDEDLAVLWEESTLKGLHKNLEEVIEHDKTLVWPEIYGFLLADIAMSLRKVTDLFDTL